MHTPVPGEERENRQNLLSILTRARKAIMPKRHRKKNPRRKKAPAKQVAQARADAEPGDHIDPSELVRSLGVRERTWVEQYRARLEAQRMVIVMLNLSPLGTVVELEFLTPENSSLPSIQDIEALLHRVAANCGREFAPRRMVILTDQRRCKAKFEVGQ